MRLSKWIFNKIKELDYLVYNTIPSEETIEKWLLEYKESVGDFIIEEYLDADSSL